MTRQTVCDSCDSVISDHEPHLTIDSYHLPNPIEDDYCQECSKRIQEVVREELR